MTTKTTEKPHGLALLREPFPPNQISKLPKPKSKDAPKGKCQECGGWHGLPAVHLDYVGHAALTARLLDADPGWHWEPVGFDDKGLPALDQSGGLWIKLTVCGVTRFGYGDAQGKTGPDAMKERIGDALRNAAMRFGAALDLWHKGDLYAHEHGEEDERRPEAPKLDTSPKARAGRIIEGVSKGDEVNAAAAMAGWDEDLKNAVWDLLPPKVQDKLTAVWPQEPATT
jgi:hypothetical protein